MHCHGPVEDELCICFHVPRAKVVRYVRRERPRVASLISECLSAGTGCGWCVPFLIQLHEDVMAGREVSAPMSAEEYQARRAEYRRKVAAGDPDPRAGT